MAADMRRAAETTGESSSNAVGLLYERYSGRILAYCLHALRDRSEAEDAVQTTFLQAHRALSRGVTPEHEFAWLHTVAKNVCRMQKRTAARRAVVTGVDLDAYSAVGDTEDEQELRRVLRDALASMPETQRRALVMRELQGLSSAEVASRMGMSTPATYALLTRARRSLADGLTTVKGRSALGVNVWPLLVRLKAFFAGGTAKVATATAIVVAVGASGATVERTLVDRPNSPSLDEQSVVGGETSMPVSGRVVHTRDSAPSARGAGGPRGGAPTRDAGVTALVPGRPDAADIPTPALPRTEPEAPTPTGAPETPTAVEDELEAALDAVPELPLPEVDIDVVTDIVPDEPLPPIDDSGLTVPVQVPPLPELPPLP